MKILYLINHAGAGGTEKYLKILLDNLKEIEPIVCYNEEGLLVSELKEKGIKTIRLNMRSPFDLIAAGKIAKIVKENKIDIIHSQYLRENYIAILAKLFGSKAKIVYTCHFNQIDTKKVRFMNKIFYKHLDKIIAIAKIVEYSLIKSGADKEKIKVIYHGVKLSEKSAPLVECKTKYLQDVEKDKFVISCASRFSEEKGNEFLIRSIEKLNKMTSKPFKVLLANEGQTLENCKKMVKDLKLEKVVKFLGYLKDDIDDLYLASDICVTPSKTEGLGLATLESLRFGVPCVVTETGGLTEIINDKNKCGIVVTYGQEEEMANALLTLMDDENLRKTYKLNAKKVIEDTFSLDKMLKNTEYAYNEVLKEREYEQN